MRILKSNKYGIRCSIDFLADTDNHLHVSAKWLVSRWYAHGASAITITTLTSKPKSSSLLIGDSSILFILNNFNLNELLNFSPLQTKLLQSVFYNKLYSFLKFH